MLSLVAAVVVVGRCVLVRERRAKSVTEVDADSHFKAHLNNA